MNRVAALAWQHVFGFANVDSLTKRIPDIVFNVTESLRLAFLRGYLLGDGTVAHNRIAFSTSSYDIASGIVYCLSSLGVVPSTSERDPDGVIREVNGAPCETKHRHWIISVCAAWQYSHEHNVRLWRALQDLLFDGRDTVHDLLGRILFVTLDARPARFPLN